MKNYEFVKKENSVALKGVAAVFIMIGHLLPQDVPFFLDFFFQAFCGSEYFSFFQGMD